VPIQQARSEATYQALISAGRKALEEHRFGEMTIASLARSAGASVGAFYGRFENKQAYFSAIQETVVAEEEARVNRFLNQLDEADASVAEFICVIAAMWVSIFGQNRGLYLAAFKDSTSLPNVWTPFKRLGWQAAGRVTAKLLPRLKRMRTPSTERDIRIAMQFMNGMLVNATINDPGPIHLKDKEMVPYLIRLLCTFLGVEPPNARAAAAAVRRVASERAAFERSRSNGQKMRKAA
jgi:AcrR family transcriptional regulator